MCCFITLQLLSRSATCAVTCLSALIGTSPLQAFCEGGHCCPGILAGHNVCNDRQMVPLAHLLQPLTKGGFCARSRAPCLVYSLLWESAEWGKRGEDREMVWSNGAYQIKLFFLCARTLHNWHEQVHKKESSFCEPIQLHAAERWTWRRIVLRYFLNSALKGTIMT